MYFIVDRLMFFTVCVCAELKGILLTYLRAFAVEGPKAWNQLPMHIRARESVGSFKTALKSHFSS